MENSQKIIEFTSFTVVKEENTAIAMGSGDMPIFATPSMCALMENAAMNAAKEYMDGSGLSGTTVGTLLNVTHIKASPVGNEIKAVAQLSAVDKRRLIFKVSAYDTTANALIGEGDHERFIVDREKFLGKLK